METGLHAVTHVEKKGCRDDLLCAEPWGLSPPRVWLPCLFSNCSRRSSLHPSQQSRITSKIIFGANSDEYQILLIYSCTVSEYKRKQLQYEASIRSLSGRTDQIQIGLTGRFTRYRDLQLEFQDIHISNLLTEPYRFNLWRELRVRLRPFSMLWMEEGVNFHVAFYMSALGLCFGQGWK